MRPTNKKQKIRTWKKPYRYYNTILSTSFPNLLYKRSVIKIDSAIFKTKEQWTKKIGPNTEIDEKDMDIIPTKQIKCKLESLESALSTEKCLLLDRHKEW